MCPLGSLTSRDRKERAPNTAHYLTGHGFCSSKGAKLSLLRQQAYVSWLSRPPWCGAPAISENPEEELWTTAQEQPSLGPFTEKALPQATHTPSSRMAENSFLLKTILVTKTHKNKQIRHRNEPINQVSVCSGGLITQQAWTVQTLHFPAPRRSPLSPCYISHSVLNTKEKI